MVITREGFTTVVANAYAGFGFPPDGPTVYEFPTEMFEPGSDLTPINENIDKIVYGLTEWVPAIEEVGIRTPPNITVQGSDYEEAVANMNKLFLRNMWGDGLPLLPPTVERVNWILSGTDLPRDTLVGGGEILPRGGLASVESLGVALAMAGGRPEYMPVLIAAVEAMLKEDLRHYHWNATTASTYPVFIISGPIAKQIRLNSGYGCLGPDPQRPAGASIGRATRLILQNLGGGLPGIGSMAIHGGANKYTNLVFAEDEAGVPSTWDSLSVSRGYPAGSNTVTCYAVEGTVNISGAAGIPPDDETARRLLSQLAGFIGVPSSRYPSYGGRYPNYIPGIVLYPRGTAQGLADVGWSKEQVQTFLWENAMVPWDMIERTKTAESIEGFVAEGILTVGEPVPITQDPKNIMIVVAGGLQSGHAYWMQGGNGVHGAEDAEIELPANWEELLGQAEEDLGPLPAD
jgi:hypothetical protein